MQRRGRIKVWYWHFHLIRSQKPGTVRIGMSMEPCCLIRRQRLDIDIYMAPCHIIGRQRHGIDINFFLRSDH